MLRYPPIDRLALSSDEIHLWRLDLAESDMAMRGDPAWLSEDERWRAAGFGNVQGRRHFIQVRLALRALLADYLECRPHDVRLIVGDHGKPRLQGSDPDQGLVFNVSHSGNRALFAFARDRALGVDLEFSTRARNLEPLARRILGPEELAVWARLDPECRSARFYAWWVCKEAFAKACGLGIQVGLQAVGIDLVAPAILSMPGKFGLPADWHLVDVTSGDRAPACLCYRGAVAKLLVADLADWWPAVLKFREIG